MISVICAVGASLLLIFAFIRLYTYVGRKNFEEKMLFWCTNAVPRDSSTNIRINENNLFKHTQDSNSHFNFSVFTSPRLEYAESGGLRQESYVIYADRYNSLIDMDSDLKDIGLNDTRLIESHARALLRSNQSIIKRNTKTLLSPANIMNQSFYRLTPKSLVTQSALNSEKIQEFLPECEIDHAAVTINDTVGMLNWIITKSHAESVGF